MAQRKRNERPASENWGEQARLDADGYERPGPHADVLFALTVDPDLGRRRRFWTKLVGRGPRGVESRIVRPVEPEADTTSK